MKISGSFTTIGSNGKPFRNIIHYNDELQINPVFSIEQKYLTDKIRFGETLIREFFGKFYVVRGIAMTDKTMSTMFDCIIGILDRVEKNKTENETKE